MRLPPSDRQVMTAAQSAPGKLAKDRRCKSSTVRRSQPPRPSDGASRKAQLEAFTGETTGWVLSCERVEFRGADAVLLAGSNNLPAQMACGRGASRSRRPHARGDVLCTEPGRPHSCPYKHAGPAHAGNSRTMSMYAGEEFRE